jgi:hypothetical protein
MKRRIREILEKRVEDLLKMADNLTPLLLAARVQKPRRSDLKSR